MSPSVKQEDPVALIPLPGELVHPFWFWFWGLLYSAICVAVTWVVLFSDISLSPELRHTLIFVMYVAQPLFAADIILRLNYLPVRRYCRNHGIQPPREASGGYVPLSGYLKGATFFSIACICMVYWSTADAEACIGRKCGSAPVWALLFPPMIIFLFALAAPYHRRDTTKSSPS